MQTLIQKAKHIKLLLLDVDGILTDGTLYYDSEGGEIKGFHVHDGLGIKLLRKNNIETGIISARPSAAVIKRAKDLGITHVYLDQHEKLSAYEQIKIATGYNDIDIAYMGDDLPDLPLLRRVGLSATVATAPDIIIRQVDFIAQKKAGKGAVRELCELILSAQDLFDSSLQPYLCG